MFVFFLLQAVALEFVSFLSFFSFLFLFKKKRFRPLRHSLVIIFYLLCIIVIIIIITTTTTTTIKLIIITFKGAI